jgi:O-antigen ligase
MFYVDNQYLKVMVELGLLGLFGLLLLFFGWIKEIWHAAGKANPRDRDLLVAVSAACIAYMVTLATYDSFGFAQVTYLFFIIAGLGASLARISLRTVKVDMPESAEALYGFSGSSFTRHFGSSLGSKEQPLNPGVDPYGA